LCIKIVPNSCHSEIFIGPWFFLSVVLWSFSALSKLMALEVWRGKSIKH
jgi:hypothetical protein